MSDGWWAVAYLVVGFVSSIGFIRWMWLRDFRANPEEVGWDSIILVAAAIITLMWPVGALVLLFFGVLPFFKWLYTPSKIRKAQKK